MMMVNSLIRLSLLSFKLKRAEELIAARSGLALSAEFMKDMRGMDHVNKYFPKIESPCLSRQKPPIY
jgi:hypothetical protein